MFQTLASTFRCLLPQLPLRSQSTGSDPQAGWLWGRPWPSGQVSDAVPCTWDVLVGLSGVRALGCAGGRAVSRAASWPGAIWGDGGLSCRRLPALRSLGWRNPKAFLGYFHPFALLIPEESSNNPDLPIAHAQRRGGDEKQRVRSGLSGNDPCFCRCQH